MKNARATNFNGHMILRTGATLYSVCSKHESTHRLLHWMAYGRQTIRKKIYTTNGTIDRNQSGTVYTVSVVTHMSLPCTHAQAIHCAHCRYSSRSGMHRTSLYMRGTIPKWGISGIIYCVEWLSRSENHTISLLTPYKMYETSSEQRTRRVTRTTVHTAQFIHSAY